MQGRVIILIFHMLGSPFTQMCYIIHCLCESIHLLGYTWELVEFVTSYCYYLEVVIIQHMVLTHGFGTFLEVHLLLFDEFLGPPSTNSTFHSTIKQVDFLEEPLYLTFVGVS